MIDIRTMDGGTSCYRMERSDSGVSFIAYSWPERAHAHLDEEVVRLMRETTASSPIIGFGETISDAQAASYTRELRENLEAGKCRLLTIRAADRELIGLCTLKRNLNPNNRHIGDLAKGMIAEQYRGRIVLAAAFYEIALQCESDGIELVTLDVRADTPAHRAWERYGFVTYGTLHDYARVNGRSCAGHFMTQQVSSLKMHAFQALQAKRAYAAATAPARQSQPVPA